MESESTARAEASPPSDLIVGAPEKPAMRFSDSINRSVGSILSYGLIPLVLVILYEVAARFVFGKATLWAHDVALMIFAGMTLMMGGYGVFNRNHVRVDIIWDTFSTGRKAALDTITAAFSLSFAAVLLRYSIPWALQSLSDHEVMPTAWHPTIWPLKMLVPAGAALLFLQMLAQLLRDIRTARTEDRHAGGRNLLPIVLFSLFTATIVFLFFQRLPVSFGPIATASFIFAGMLCLLFLGLPVAFSMGGIAVLVVFLVGDPATLLHLVVGNTFAVANSYSLIAIPLFLFIALMLQATGIMDDVFESLRLWFDRIPGGLAVAVTLASIIIAAISGFEMTAILILGVVAVPFMLKLNYSKEMAFGPVTVGGMLALLIPPSGGFIIYGALAQVSVGQLFMGGLIPGLLLGGMYILYIVVRCLLNPRLAPRSTGARVPLRVKVASLKSMWAPALLIASILVPIYTGIASATESAAVGVLGSVVIAAATKRLSWKTFAATLADTAKVSVMCMWVVIGAYCFKSVFAFVGGSSAITMWLTNASLTPILVVLAIQVIWFILGALVTDLTIMLLTLPVILPIIDAFGLSRIWMGVLFIMNMQMAAITPPVGFSLFFMKGVAPKGTTMKDLIKATLPFLPIQMAALGLVIIWPQLALWLPGLMAK